MAVEGKVNRLDLVTALDAKVRRYLQAEQEKIQLAKPKPYFNRTNSFGFGA